ncbi:hypothetical protein BV898_05959 [Hypsibius exemplaris]|uniref:Uncharacterized protein n=1 Tax=Hypsibius exemplaris TaxID=2072580 RepID=A0A1W0WXL8_HYPEX|nr:hypothetical protein BV898_05959 [Hypsibius exemplaris]
MIRHSRSVLIEEARGQAESEDRPRTEPATMMAGNLSESTDETTEQLLRERKHDSAGLRLLKSFLMDRETVCLLVGHSVGTAIAVADSPVLP